MHINISYITDCIFPYFKIKKIKNKIVTVTVRITLNHWKNFDFTGGGTLLRSYKS